MRGKRAAAECRSDRQNAQFRGSWGSIGREDGGGRIGGRQTFG
jgi:hypothetical protein